MSNNVTDRLLLKQVYDMYHDEFCALQGGKGESKGTVYLPIDCQKIGSALRLNPQIVFGRLYYHLDKKYRYRQDDDSLVHLFALKVGDEKHCINFPLLSAVLAELEQSYYRFFIPIIVSVLALFISIASFVYSGA